MDGALRAVGRGNALVPSPSGGRVPLVTMPPDVADLYPPIEERPWTMGPVLTWAGLFTAIISNVPNLWRPLKDSRRGTH